ncbi:hypothetical protein VNO80_21066 [Phaseolus coccineus]|uniref:Uncharacterized protein n=1 Tax=Phaseolus coccineus TaxID=3886 RepID=A0AAN9M1R2_PHACN
MGREGRDEGVLYHTQKQEATCLSNSSFTFPYCRLLCSSTAGANGSSGIYTWFQIDSLSAPLTIQNGPHHHHTTDTYRYISFTFEKKWFFLGGWVILVSLTNSYIPPFTPMKELPSDSYPVSLQRRDARPWPLHAVIRHDIGSSIQSEYVNPSDLILPDIRD